VPYWLRGLTRELFGRAPPTDPEPPEFQVGETTTASRRRRPRGRTRRLLFLGVRVLALLALGALGVSPAIVPFLLGGAVGLLVAALLAPQ